MRAVKVSGKSAHSPGPSLLTDAIVPKFRALAHTSQLICPNISRNDAEKSDQGVAQKRDVRIYFDV